MERKATQEEMESFRSSLEDLLTIADKMIPYCKTTEEIIGMARLATENDGQLRLLMSLIAQGSKK